METSYGFELYEKNKTEHTLLRNNKPVMAYLLVS